MNTELQLLYLFSNKEYYYNYNKYINNNYISSESLTLLLSLDNYFMTYPATFIISWPDYKTWFFTVYKPSLDPDRQAALEAIINQLIEAADKGEATNPRVLVQLAERDLGTRLYETAYRMSEGENDKLSEIERLLEAFHELSVELGLEAEPNPDEEKELEAALQDFTPVHTGLTWRLEELNKSIGPINKGDLIALGGRPDCGKTTMLASESTYMGSQLPEDKYVLWVNNEERKSKVYRRIVQAALNKTRAELDSMSTEDIKEHYSKAVGSMGRVRLKDGACISAREIEELLEKGDVGLLIIDQIYDIKSGSTSKLEAEAFRQSVRKTREWAKLYCPVIFTVWADGSAEGERWIQQNQLYGSKTGLQGGVDAIIGIGRYNFEHLKDQDNRYIFISKNKLEYGTDPTSKNGKFTVKIDANRARFKS